MLKSIFGLFDLSYIFPLKQDRNLFYTFASIFLVYSFGVVPDDIMLIFALGIFLCASVRSNFFMLIFFLCWEFVSVFSFGISLVLMLQIIFSIKLVSSKELAGFSLCQQRKLFKSSLAAMILLVPYGIMSLVSGYGFTGLSFVFKAFIFLYAIKFLSEDEGQNAYKAIFHILVFSSIFATIYGHFHETSIERWISGMGTTASQLYGTLGTTRMGLFYVISTMFFLLFIDNKTIKYVGSLAFAVLSFMTVSITVAAILVCSFLLYLSLKFGKRVIIYSLLFVTLVVSTFNLWSKVSFMVPIVSRIESTIELAKLGDLDKASSGREELGTHYIQKYEDSPLFIQLFGYAATSAYSTGGDLNSHNSYIDLLYYCGALGLLFFLFYEIKKFLIMKSTSVFVPWLFLKFILLGGALSVSVLSSMYFAFGLFI